MERYGKTSILLIILGLTSLIIYEIVYPPRFNALQHAIEVWSQTHSGTPPSMASFGLSPEYIFIAGLLGLLASLSLFAGLSIAAILIVAKILRRLGYVKSQT